MLILREPFASLWRGKDAFDEVEKISGEVARALETRRTLRFEVDGKGYYLKLHHGTTVKEILKNLLSFRLPVLGADREWNAIHRLKEHGVGTMTGVAYGQKNWNPLTRTSFIITEDLAPVMSLEEYCADWKVSRPNVKTKRLIIERVATMVREMHRCGINHRDCYICHFLMSLPFDGTEQGLQLSIIDLHRAQLREKVPLRWRNKDLIGLYYSSLNCGLSKTDIFRFLKTYFQSSLRDILTNESAFIEKARNKASKIQERTIRKKL